MRRALPGGTWRIRHLARAIRDVGSAGRRESVAGASNPAVLIQCTWMQGDDATMPHETEGSFDSS